MSNVEDDCHVLKELDDQTGAQEAELDGDEAMSDKGSQLEAT